MKKSQINRITQRKSIALFSVFFFGYLVILILLVGGIYISTEKRVHREFQLREQYICSKTVDITNEFVQQIKSDILFLTRQSKLFYSNNSGNFEKHLVETYYQFAIAKGAYNQIRFIALDGKEKVRIDYSDENAKVVEKDKLQDKSNRYYFQKIKNLSQDSIYFSPLDLNVENEKIEIPYKPMIRVGSPVFDENKELIGMVVLNFFGNIILNKIYSEDKGTRGKILFLNSDGYYFIGLNKEDEWGFMFDDKKDKTFFADFKEEGDEVYNNESGTILSSKGIFTYATINLSVHKSEHLSTLCSNCNSLLWKLVCFVPEAEIKEIITTEMLSSWISLLIVSFVLLILFWFLSRNIILKMEARAQLVERNNELSYANATKDKFFSIIAHDLKSPFSGLIGLTEILVENGTELSEERLQSVRKSIYTTTKNIYLLLENLLQWARLQTNRLTPNPVKFDINKIIDEIMDLVQRSAEQKEIRLIWETESLMNVWADKEMINTALRNIVSNSVKYTSDGGYIKVSVSTVKKYAEIRIQDNGVGMNKGVVNNLFQPGKVKSQPGTANETGTGLGLILCKEFIDLNNGEIFVESELNVGTTFIVHVPLSKK